VVGGVEPNKGAAAEGEVSRWFQRSPGRSRHLVRLAAAELLRSAARSPMARRLQAKPKERRKVAIPAELQDSLREVFELIEEAKNDPDINLNYDDAIQVGAVCGGRYGKKPRPYVLTYYPEDDKEKGRWYLTLHGTEVEDIGDRRMTEITMFCCTSPDCRSKFREADEHCFYCDYVDD
jgi:hypothetical protein